MEAGAELPGGRALAALCPGPRQLGEVRFPVTPGATGEEGRDPGWGICSVPGACGWACLGVDTWECHAALWAGGHTLERPEAAASRGARLTLLRPLPAVLMGRARVARTHCRLVGDAEDRSAGPTSRAACLRLAWPRVVERPGAEQGAPSPPQLPRGGGAPGPWTPSWPCLSYTRRGEADGRWPA